MLDILRLAALYTLPFLAILTLVVTIHELGHFWAAKACGVAIDRFSIGFGRAIARFTDKSGVEWRLGWIPLGGYVRYAGDTNDASVPDSDDLEELRRLIIEKHGPEAVKRFYHFKPTWQRAIVAAAGPAANFILAIAIFTIMFSTLQIAHTRPIVGSVTPGTPAAAAGFQADDVIKRANGHVIRDFADFQTIVSLRANEEITVDVERAGQLVRLHATPRRVADKDKLTGVRTNGGRIGLSVREDAVYWERLPPGPALVEALRTVRTRIGTTLTYIGRIFRGQENGDQFSSIVGMANVAGTVTEVAIEQGHSVGERLTNSLFMLIQLAASLSIGIGFVNLLPIPVLDGGHLMFYAYEAVVRKPVGATIQAASLRVGLALVLGLMLFATWNDLHRMQAFQFLGGLFS